MKLNALRFTYKQTNTSSVPTCLLFYFIFLSYLDVSCLVLACLGLSCLVLPGVFIDGDLPHVLLFLTADVVEHPAYIVPE